MGFRDAETTPGEMLSNAGFQRTKTDALEVIGTLIHPKQLGAAVDPMWESEILLERGAPAVRLSGHSVSSLNEIISSSSQSGE